jgi:filamentous hemagglutinin family protein
MHWSLIRNIARLLVVYLVAWGLIFPPYVFANPLDPDVIAGDITVEMLDAANMEITQYTEQGIINWGSFSIGSEEAVSFLQPGSTSVLLNRVIGLDPSILNGVLSANGRIFLLNNNGILIGAGAQINVSSFLASTLNISDEDFLSGNYKFTQDPGKGLSYVINKGNIAAQDGGFVALAAPSVLNEGKITATIGNIGMLSGDEVVLNFFGDDLIGFTVEGDLMDEILGPDGENVNAGVTNTGEISADGGEVVLSARTAYDAIKSVVNNEGIIEARSINNVNGVIVLDGGDSGVVENSGALVASGDDAGETGGTVQMTGQYVGLFDNANINVSGDAGGGTALVGGDYQGSNPDIQNATATYVGSDATITADAGTSGDGGEVIVWADGDTRYYGDISVRGGSGSGDAGFVEVSGKEYLDFRGDVDLSAAMGESGMLLLDPANITIQNGAGTLDDELDGGTDKTIAFGDGGTDTTLDAAELEAFSSGTIVLQARDVAADDSEGNITFDYDTSFRAASIL